MTQLFFIPAEGRTITSGGLAAEVEYIGGEYALNVNMIIADMIDSGAVIQLSSDDPRTALAEDEQRTVLIAELFSVISDDICETAEDEQLLIANLRRKTDAELSQLRKLWLS